MNWLHRARRELNEGADAPAVQLTERLAALVPHYPVLAHASVTCDLAVDTLTVTFTPEATDDAIEAVAPLIEDAVARVREDGHLFSFDIILRADGFALSPSRLIH